MISLQVPEINDHGKRADSIIKGMLLHSRAKQGINNLRMLTQCLLNLSTLVIIVCVHRQQF